jgi:hypothetical protein
MLYALACAGILITTGGCAEMATAPEAATAERATAGAKNAPAPAPAPGEEEEITIESGYLEGGG